jgi:dihydrofolate reductase
VTTLTLIAACDEHRGIGFEGKLPWHLPKDFAFFKQQTLGKCLLMGRKTFESIGKPLPNRRNVVLTSKPLDVPGIETITDIKQLSDLGEEEVMIIGGQQLYELMLPLANKIILTKVHGVFEVDTYFPALSEERFICEKQDFHPADENNAYAITFMFYRRI